MAADEKIAGIRWANTKETRLKTQMTGEVMEDDSGESNGFTASQMPDMESKTKSTCEKQTACV